MNKFITVTYIFVLILLVVIPVGLTFLIRIIPNDIQPSLNDTEKIYDDYLLSQSFISLQDNLSGIGVSIKNPNFANKKDLKIDIYDSDDNLLRTVVLNGQNIADGKFVKIMFDPILSTKNKKYSWILSSQESRFQDALEVFLTNQKPSWILDFRVKDSLKSNGLSFVTLHKVSSPTEVLNKVLGEALNNLIKDKAFFITYGGIILMIWGSLVYLSFKK